MMIFFIINVQYLVVLGGQWSAHSKLASLPRQEHTHPSTAEQPAGKYGGWGGKGVDGKELQLGQREVHHREQHSRCLHSHQLSNTCRRSRHQQLGNLHHQQEGDHSDQQVFTKQHLQFLRCLGL